MIRSLRTLAAALVAAVALSGVASSQTEGLTPDQARRLERAQADQRDGRHGDAVRALEALGEERPDLADVPRLLAFSYHELGRTDDARAAAVRAIGLGRLTSDVLARLVQIDRGRGDVLAALDAVRLLTVLDAGDPSWRRYAAELLAETGLLSAAESIYRQAVSISPADAQSWLGLGNVLASSGRVRSAASAYETAWILGERTATLAEGIAALEQRDGDLASSVRWLEHAETLESDASGRRALRRAR
ncbi:MAG: tetratricopeptide repeat protein, partial [Planctomycetota bacterium]